MRRCLIDATMRRVESIVHDRRMRTTVNLAEDALLAARHVAQRERISLGEALSELVRRGVQAGSSGAAARSRVRLKGRFALLPARDEIVTPAQVRELMEREGI